MLNSRFMGLLVLISIATSTPSSGFAAPYEVNSSTTIFGPHMFQAGVKPAMQVRTFASGANAGSQSYLIVKNGIEYKDPQCDARSLKCALLVLKANLEMLKSRVVHGEIWLNGKQVAGFFYDGLWLGLREP